MMKNHGAKLLFSNITNITGGQENTLPIQASEFHVSSIRQKKSSSKSLSVAS